MAATGPERQLARRLVGFAPRHHPFARDGRQVADLMAAGASTVVDGGMTRETAAQRLTETLDALRRGDILLVVSLDRLTCGGGATPEIARAVQRGLDVRATRQPFDTTHPLHGSVLRAVVIALAQAEQMHAHGVRAAAADLTPHAPPSWATNKHDP